MEDLESLFARPDIERHLILSTWAEATIKPLPAFYARPNTLSEAVDYTIVRILDQLGINVPLVPRWGEYGMYPP